MNHAGFAPPSYCSRQRSGVKHVTVPDPNPLADCDGATLFDRQFASTIYCVDRDHQMFEAP
jgi:hypothetical protein